MPMLLGSKIGAVEQQPRCKLNRYVDIGANKLLRGFPIDFRILDLDYGLDE